MTEIALDHETALNCYRVFPYQFTAEVQSPVLARAHAQQGQVEIAGVGIDERNKVTS